MPPKNRQVAVKQVASESDLATSRRLGKQPWKFVIRVIRCAYHRMLPRMPKHLRHARAQVSWRARLSRAQSPLRAIFNHTRLQPHLLQYPTRMYRAPITRASLFVASVARFDARCLYVERRHHLLAAPQRRLIRYGASRRGARHA